MLGVALIATAFFKEDWQAGMMAGALAIIFGALFHGLSLPAGRRKNEPVLLAYDFYDLRRGLHLLALGPRHQ